MKKGKDQFSSNFNGDSGNKDMVYEEDILAEEGKILIPVSEYKRNYVGSLQEVQIASTNNVKKFLGGGHRVDSSIEKAQKSRIELEDFKRDLKELINYHEEISLGDALETMRECYGLSKRKANLIVCNLIIQKYAKVS